jgi:cytoskeleton protein RodZ
LSVEQAAEQLRLTVAVVGAMEEGRYQELGPPVFARGYLRKYARLVGVPVDAILEAYESSSSRVADSTLIPPASAHTPVGSDHGHGRRRNLIPWIAALGVAVLGAAGWWYWQGRDNAGQPAVSDDTGAAEVLEAPAPSSFEPAPEQPAPEAATPGPAGRQTAEPAATPDPP